MKTKPIQQKGRGAAGMQDAALAPSQRRVRRRQKPLWLALLPSTASSVLVMAGISVGLAVVVGGCGSGGGKGGSKPAASPTVSATPTASPTPALNPTPSPSASPIPVPTPLPPPAPTPVPIVVTVSPAAVTLSVNDSTTFTADVTGTANPAVLWQVQEADGGTIDGGSGKYVAPPTRGTYHVVAVSAVDGSAKGTATVFVQSGGIGGTIN